MAKFETTTDLNVRSGPGVNYESLDLLQKGEMVEEVAVVGWMPVEMDDGSIGWVSRQFLALATDESPTPPVVPGIEPVQIRWARSKLGQHEVPGVGDNPEIVSWYHLTTLPESEWHDSTAWCAVFVNAGLLLNGIPSLKSAAAVDYLKLGVKTTTPKKGDLVVWAHHVAFFLADLGNGRIQVIGGNQRDAVTITTYPKDNTILGFRRVA